MRVGTYARTSELVRPTHSNIGTHDLLDAERLADAVTRQEADTRALAQLRGWTLVETYQDPDHSAYQPKVTRPDFERMLKDLETGVIQGIVVYDLDRLARQPKDLERIIDIYDRKPLIFATVQGSIDLSTPDGRTMARVLVAMANKSSMDTARRVARKKLERATNGLGFSNYRPFGWNEDRLTLNEPEAAILRQAATDVLTGTGLFVICGRLNARGIRTVRGNIWKTHAMRRVLCAPRIAGLAVYQRELLTDSLGQPTRGKWQPILDEATWRAVTEILSNTRANRFRPQEYMLTNIARCGLCGLCGKGLVASRAKKTFKYECRSVDSGGCSGVAINGPRLERQVEEHLFAYLEGRAAQPDRTWDGQAKLDEITIRIGELMEQYRAGLLPGTIVFPNVRQLEDDRENLEADRAKFTALKARKAVTLDGDWGDMDLYARRAVIKAHIEAVVIKPTGRTGLYDPSRVDVVPLA